MSLIRLSHYAGLRILPDMPRAQGTGPTFLLHFCADRLLCTRAIARAGGGAWGSGGGGGGGGSPNVPVQRADVPARQTSSPHGAASQAPSAALPVCDGDLPRWACMVEPSESHVCHSARSLPRHAAGLPPPPPPRRRRRAISNCRHLLITAPCCPPLPRDHWGKQNETCPPLPPSAPLAIFEPPGGVAPGFALGGRAGGVRWGSRWPLHPSSLWVDNQPPYPRVERGGFPPQKANKIPPEGPIGTQPLWPTPPPPSPPHQGPILCLKLWGVSLHRAVFTVYFVCGQAVLSSGNPFGVCGCRWSHWQRRSEMSSFVSHPQLHSVARCTSVRCVYGTRNPLHSLQRVGVRLLGGKQGNGVQFCKEGNVCPTAHDCVRAASAHEKLSLWGNHEGQIQDRELEPQSPRAVGLAHGHPSPARLHTSAIHFPVLLCHPGNPQPHTKDRARRATNPPPPPPLWETPPPPPRHQLDKVTAGNQCQTRVFLPPTATATAIKTMIMPVVMAMTTATTATLTAEAAPKAILTTATSRPTKNTVS